MILLGVNIDHCATLRQARYRGADGITVHLREDRRHMQDRDVWRLRESPTTRLNLEMACTPGMTELALALKPQAVCVVPESRQEVTTEGRLDVVGGRDRVKACIDAVASAGIEA